jgi:hypothetical protein
MRHPGGRRVAQPARSRRLPPPTRRTYRAAGAAVPLQRRAGVPGALRKR